MKRKNDKSNLRRGMLFMVPAMLLAAKGFSDLWVSGCRQPWLALTALALGGVMALMGLTLVSAGTYLLYRRRWIPPAELIVLLTGVVLYLQVSLGRSYGTQEILVPVGLWLFWALLALRARQEAVERD